MQSCNQRCKFLLLDVLHLVDEHRQRRVTSLRCSTGRLEQALQIVLKIPVVSQSRLWIVVKTDFNIVELHLKRLRKTRKRTHPRIATALVASTRDILSNA